MDGRYGELRCSFEGERFSKRGQIFAICGDISPRPHLGLYRACIERFKALKGVSLCKKAKEFADAENRGECAAVLAIEGAEVIDCDPGLLRAAARDGVKVIAPTWNVYNGLCGTASELCEKGLTPAGYEFCDEAVRNGLLLDVSHASPKAAFEMVGRYGRKVFASHSNSRSLCPHKRNVSDELFRAIAENGGTVGINLYTPFLSEGRCDISTVADHICHFADLMPRASGHISLGFDLDGCDSLPEGFSASKDAVLLADELSGRGFDRQSIIDIFHDNLFGFIWERQEI